MEKPIAISLSPNTENEDIFLALKLLFSPWRYFGTDGIESLEKWFKEYFKTSFAVSFNSGRAALYAILNVLKIKKGDEVIIQSFTCVALPNAIIAAGAKPIYVDIKNDLTINLDDLKKKITKKTKAIIVQHTFGIPADITKIVKIGKSKKITIIEDCAHVIGETYKSRKIGIFGKAAFFSFGRDKAFSSVSGGMVITNDQRLGDKLTLFQKELDNPSFFWALQQLFHPIAFYFILPLYNFFSSGKIILVFLQKLHLLSFPVSQKEKEGAKQSFMIKKFSNSLAYLILSQLKKIEKYNQKRKEIGDFYIQNLKGISLIVPYKKSIPFLRFPILIENRDAVMDFFKKQKIYLGKWYSEIVDPKGVILERVFYRKGSCPRAEFIAEKIINLPCYPTMKFLEAEKIISLLIKYVKNRKN